MPCARAGVIVPIQKVALLRDSEATSPGVRLKDPPGRSFVMTHQGDIAMRDGLEPSAPR